MAYFKYVPFLFLIVAALFAYEGITKYVAGGDGLPYLLLSVCGVAFFFIRRRAYRRYTNPKN